LEIRIGGAVNNNFWTDKKILITGFEGFLGSNLTKELLKSKANVIGLDIKTFRKGTILCAQDYKKMSVYKGSVTNYNFLQKILRKHSINVIFHLAAEAIVGRSLKNPRRAFESNIAGTWEVLEAARLQGNLQAIIVASSDKAYGSHKKLPYHEDAPLIANHPYDVSKSCGDLIAHTYAHTYGLPVAITRCGNIYGPGDFNFSRLIPDAMRCLAKGKILQVRCDGKFVRDYVYVDDIVSGYLRIAELLKKNGLSGEAFNLSNECPLTVVKLLQMINKINLGGNKLKYRVLDVAKCEINKQYLSSAKARRVLGWKPRVAFKDGINKTIVWYREFFNNK
jgi:CDP-glucose 4,6-dehydratase